MLVFFVFTTLKAQPFAVGHLQQSFTDPTRANRAIACEIYYPAVASGNNTALAAGKFPVIVFGHGFVMAWSAYDIFWKKIVPKGYIMVFPTTESSFSPSHINFGKDMAYLTSAMKAEGNNASSFFFGAVDSTSAVMGHSMGGGCAFLSMQQDSTIDAMASFAAAVTNPSSVTAAATIRKPSLVFSGANDCVAPPSDHQIPMYNALASSCKTFISITGANHCQFASTNVNCSFGQGTCTPQATISAATQQSIMFDGLDAWLDFYLKKDCASADLFQNLISVSSGIVSQQNCSLNCNAGPGSGGDTTVVASFEIFPNPSGNTMHIKASNAMKDKVYIIYGINGNKIKIGKLSGELTIINVGELSEGVYVLRLEGGEKKVFVKGK
jgi:dienelactone hydrolase